MHNLYFINTNFLQNFVSIKIFWLNSGPLKVYLQFPKCLSHSTKTNKSSHTVKTWCIYHKQPYKTGDIETALDILFKLIHYHKKLG